MLKETKILACANASRKGADWVRPACAESCSGMIAFLFHVDLGFFLFAPEEKLADSFRNAHSDRGIFAERAQNHPSSIRRRVHDDAANLTNVSTDALPGLDDCFLDMLCLRAGDLPCLG